MAINNLTCFREENNSVIFTGNYMEVYIPKNYFESKMAEILDDRIESLGIFIFKVFNDENKKDSAITHIYKLPAKIELRPSNYKNEKMKVNNIEYEFIVLEFFKNDIFIKNTIIQQSSTMANNFITFFHNGKLPNFIDYDDILKLELNAVIINKMKFPVPSVLLECIVSEINRDSADINKPFRFAASLGANKKSYTPVSIKKLPSFSSTFSSVTFENIDYQLISSVNKTRYNKEEISSPIEETIKY